MGMGAENEKNGYKVSTIKISMGIIKGIGIGPGACANGPDVVCLSLVANFLLVTRYDLI